MPAANEWKWVGFVRHADATAFDLGTITSAQLLERTFLDRNPLINAIASGAVSWNGQRRTHEGLVSA